MDRHARRAVVGAGSWGTTLALHLAKQGPVVLLARDEEQARALSVERCNKRYLPDITIPVEVEITADASAVANADELVVFAVPAAAMRSTAARVSPFVGANAVLLSVAKGIEHESLLRMTQVIESEIPAVAGRTAALSGPNPGLGMGDGLPGSGVKGGGGGGGGLRRLEMIGTRSFR